MGLTPPTPPPDYGPGDDCLVCYAPGHTPNYCFIRFWDIESCGFAPDPPNGCCFVCKQNAINPCVFIGELEFGGETWEARWDAWESGLRLWMTSAPSWFVFRCLEDACVQDFPTNEFECNGKEYFGGHGHVDIFTTAIIIGFTHHYHFVTVPGVKYEHFKCGIDHSCWRLAAKHDHTNILILLDEEDFVIQPPDS